MQISRLEIFGFKSFMDRLILPVEPGVTGIVGPNGCGKSNIIDALRWVLGETRAKSLRGGTLEDVIFNGTDKLRPLGLAEVSITLRSSDKNFFEDLISPGLEAELFAEEEERKALAELEAIEGAVPANSNEDRSEDLADAGTVEGLEPVAERGANGRPLLKVIQGQLLEATSAREGVNALLSDYAGLNLPAEDILEEASEDEAESQTSTNIAGVSAETSSAISQAATLLHRFSWLKATNEVQVTRRLYRSGESEFFINRVACRLKDLKELFRAVGLGARTYTIVAQGEVSRVVTARSDERRRILEEAAGVQGFRERIVAANRRLEDTDNNIARLEDVLKERNRQVNSLKRQAARARNRQALKEELSGIEETLYRDDFFELREREQALHILHTGAEQEQQRLSSALSLGQAEEEEARSMLGLVDIEGDELRLRIDNIKEELNSRARQRSDKLSRIKELKAYCLSKETELRRIEERRAVFADRRQEHQETIEECREREADLQDNLDAIDLSAEELIASLRQQLQILRPQFKLKEQELRSLREQKISKTSTFEAINAQLIAASPIQQLKKTLNEESFLALKESTEDSCLLIDGLSVPESYTRAVQAVLEERAAFLVTEKPYEVARQFASKLDEIETSSAAACPGLGVFRAGSASISGTGNVPFRRLIDELEVTERCRKATAKLLNDVYVAESLEPALRFFEEEADSEITIVTLRGEIVTACSYYSFQHKAGLVQLKQKRDALQHELAELESHHEILQIEVAALEVEIEQKDHKLQNLGEQIEQEKQKKRDLDRDLDTVRHQLSTEERLLEQLTQDEEKVTLYEGEIKLAIEEYQEELLIVEDELESMHSDDEREMHEELRTLNENYLELDERRSRQRRALSEQVQAVEKIRRELEGIKNRVSKAALDMQRVELEREALKERVTYAYGEELFVRISREPEEGENGRIEESLRLENREQAQKIRARIQREGDVDPESIERLDEELKSLNELNIQKEDLEKAALTLRRTIGRLRETSELRFMETFARVEKNFSRLIPRLFGGGRGALELSDPANPLESGLEIIARPPGKKLKSIELLSGGEKALCATALIFALFLERPSPLCVLDEVDAPLDDANLVRFISLVKEMSSKTQFLVITHNKITMAASDQLAGVTMEQPGASRVLSVSLQEALDHVA